MQTQEVEKFQLLASTSLASKVADFLYFTRASSDTTSQEVIFLTSREARVNRIIDHNIFKIIPVFLCNLKILIKHFFKLFFYIFLNVCMTLIFVKNFLKIFSASKADCFYTDEYVCIMQGQL